MTGDLLAGLPDDVSRLLAQVPVTDKKLLELSISWAGLSGGRARMASALRTFVITWDPLEPRAPRPDGFAAVNAGSLGLEIAVYLPAWRLAELASARNRSAGATLAAMAGSAVVTAAAHAEPLVSGRYADLVAAGSAPDLLADPAAGATLGPARIQADPPSWNDIGLGAISDIVQHAYGQVDLDRSPVELGISSQASPGCPACAGRRFGFPADLAESRDAMCAAHRSQAAAVISERLRRAERSNPRGWAALADATIRRELPHLPNGLATKLSRAEQAMYIVPTPEELAERARHVVEAASWFPGRARDLAVALGQDPDLAPGLPDWLANLVLDLGRAGLGPEAAGVGEALAKVDPGMQSVFEGDVAVAVARAGRAADARARVDANLARWPADVLVRMQAGETLEALGDLDGAAAHFDAARDMADEADDFEARANAEDLIRQLRRRRARESGPGPGVQRRQRPGKASRSQRRRRS
jgi:hypothetical protein